MDVLRCKAPELVRKEIWTHALAYNLFRTVIAQAAHPGNSKLRLRHQCQQVDVFGGEWIQRAEGAGASPTAIGFLSAGPDAAPAQTGHELLQGRRVRAQDRGLSCGE